MFCVLSLGKTVLEATSACAFFGSRTDLAKKIKMPTRQRVICRTDLAPKKKNASTPACHLAAT